MKHQGDVLVADPSNFQILDNAKVEVLEAEEEEDTNAPAIETEEAKKIRKKIKDLSKKIGESYWELSELVARVHNDKLFKQWGYKTFAAWTQVEFDVGRRKAYYFAQIQNYFKNDLKKSLPENLYNEAVSVAKQIGWNKALLVATENVITPNNCQDVLMAAKTLSLDALKNECKARFKGLSKKEKEESKESNTMKMVKKSFQLSMWQDEVVSSALEKGKKALKEGASDSSALAMILGEYDANSGDGSLATKLSNFERMLGVKLIALSPNLSRCLFGEDTLATLANVGSEEAEATEELPSEPEQAQEQTGG